MSASYSSAAAPALQLPADSTRPQRLPALDSLRGMAALLVALYHVSWNSHITRLNLIRNSWTMVDLFFVLSGFVICHSYGNWRFDARHALRFMGIRFGRLYPLHVATLLVAVFLEIARTIAAAVWPGSVSVPPFSINTPGAIVTNLLLIHGLGVHGHPTWNVPSWSISTEFYTYLVFAGVCAVAAASRVRMAGLSAVLIMVALPVVWFGIGGLEDTYRLAFFRCLLGFFSGALAYQAWRLLKPRRSHATLLTAIAVIAMLAVAFLPHGREQIALVPLFALLVFASASYTNVRGLTAAPLVRLGEISYSVYMIHALILFGIESVLQHVLHLPRRGTVYLLMPLAGDLLVLAYIALLIAVASWTFKYIEDRYRRRAKVLLLPRDLHEFVI